MTILHPTKDKGATTKPMPAVYVEDPQQTLNEDLDALFEGTGLNGAFIADLLSAMLTHEQCGRHLYRTVETRTNNPMLKAKYKEFGTETERHAEILQNLITQTGGNPNYVSPVARAVEAMDSKLAESTFLLNGSIDVMTAESVMLDAVFVAESIDHTNWLTLSHLVDELPAGPIQDAFRAAVGEVGPQEEEHLTWATQTKARMVSMQVRSPVMATVGAKAEEIVAHIREWFSS